MWHVCSRSGRLVAINCLTPFYLLNWIPSDVLLVLLVGYYRGNFRPNVQMGLGYWLDSVERRFIL